MNHHRIWRLRRLRRDLKRQVRAEAFRPQPDPLILGDLKRRKLQVENELIMAEAGLAPVTTRFTQG